MKPENWAKALEGYVFTMGIIVIFMAGTYLSAVYDEFIMKRESVKIEKRIIMPSNGYKDVVLGSPAYQVSTYTVARGNFVQDMENFIPSKKYIAVNYISTYTATDIRKECK